MSGDHAQRQRVLAAFARRAVCALRAQRQRLDVEHPADYDLDFYAHAAYQLREVCRQAIERLGLDALRDPLAKLDSEIPRLRDYRDFMSHAVDDKIGRWAWFGPFAGKLLPGGNVEYLVDARDFEHAKLERFYEAVIAELDP